MRTVTSFGNFSRGRLDHSMNGRFDLPIYETGSDVFQNFISNFKGNAVYRSGFESMLAFQDCVLFEFKFNNTQDYLLCFYANEIQFAAYDTNGNFGWVLDNSGNPLKVSTPYSLAQCRQLQVAQNSDVLIVTHQSFAPYQLTRTASNAFTFAAQTRTGDPFSAGNYPACCCFYEGRLYYGNTAANPLQIWASQVANYTVFTIPTTPVDTDALTVTLADVSNPISWIYPGDNSLFAGTADGIVAINGGDINTAITPSSVTARKSTALGSNSTIPVKKNGLMFYVGLDGRNMYYFYYNLLNSRFEAKDANIISYDVTQYGMNKIRWKKDRNDLIIATRGDGQLLTLNYDQDQNINGWHNHPTPNGSFQDQALLTDPTGTPQLFVLSNRGGNFFIERQAQYIEFTQLVNFYSGPDNQQEDLTAYTRMVCEQLKQCNFLDNSQTLSGLQSNQITYNPTAGTITAASAVFSSGSVGHHIVYQTQTGYESGRFLITGYVSSTVVNVTVLQQPTANTYTNWYLTFSSISGLSQYNGMTVSVVLDGGYFEDFTVSGGAISLGDEATFACVGYTYRGIIKSFSLGFVVQGQNTQTTQKQISRVGVRTVTSAGLKVGASMYNLEFVQDRTQNDINYLPPAPMDGSKYINYTDMSEEDKYVYIVQDQPLPATITNLMVDANYTLQA